MRGWYNHRISHRSGIPKKGGLKTLERNQRLTGEMITLKAEVQGNNVPDVLWDWQVNDGTSLSLSTSQTPTVSRSQAGNIIAKVIARDKNKRTLGVAEVTVSVMEPVPVPAGKNDQSDQQQAKQKQNEVAQNKAAKKKVENAQKMLDESKQLAHKGKFDEAIEKAQEAQKDDPQNKDIEKTLDETKKKKERIDEGIKQVKNLIAESEFNKAQEILIKQKNEAAYYPPVQEVEETLRAKWQEHIAKVNAAFGGIKVKSENRDYKEALEAVDEARKSLKLAPSELKTLADQEAFLKPLVAKKEKARGLFQSSKSKFESGDYDGCIKDYLEGHNLTKNMWNVNKDKTINSAQEIYLEALKKKKENEASAAASKQTGQINSSKAKSLNPVKKAATSVFIKNNTDSMGIPKSSFEPGEEIVLDFTASPDYPEKSWIGMFKADLPHSGMAANNNHELSFKYLEKKQKDTFTFTSPTEEGEYDFRMFDRNSEEEVATLKFTISVDGDAASLLLPKKVFEPGEEIALKFTASPNYPEKSWIGMFKADLPHTGMAANNNHELSFQYLEKKQKGIFTFTSPTEEGEYDFRMFERSNGKEVATIKFSVVVDKDAASLLLPKKMFEPGEEIALKFTASPNYPEKSWIGMFKADLPHSGMAENNNHELSFQYLEKKQNGTFEFTSPTEEGTYDFRMFEKSNGKEVATIKFKVNK